MGILRVENITKKFAGLLALNSVSFKLDQGIIQAVIGPNGAGKTTLFQVISGILAPTAGRVFFKEREITQKPPYYICRLGIARTFQRIRLFPNMSVLENVMTGCHIHMKVGLILSGLRFPHIRKEEEEARRKAQLILEFMGIGEKSDQPAMSLPYGQQRLVEVSRALASEPKLLMLDEPAAGMTTAEGQILAERILQIRDKGVTIILVEHDMSLVMDISDRILVLNYGEIIAEDTPDVIQEDPRVAEAYLGTKNNHVENRKSLRCIRPDQGVA
jgi:ABC-type branched-subunit amino acid transport system ATPase component